jgi:hypothetical protein
MAGSVVCAIALGLLTACGTDATPRLTVADFDEGRARLVVSLEPQVGSDQSCVGYTVENLSTHDRGFRWGDVVVETDRNTVTRAYADDSATLRVLAPSETLRVSCAFYVKDPAEVDVKYRGSSVPAELTEAG